GTRTCPTQSTTRRSGPTSRTTPSSTTGSRCSGRNFCGPPRRAGRSRGISPRAPRACSSRGWPCSHRPRRAGSTYPRWRSEAWPSVSGRRRAHECLAGGEPMSTEIRLPGRAEPLLITEPGWARGYPPPVSRSVYAAAHVAAQPGGDIDWESTLAFRDFLWDYGFGVAEAMDTAQRGMGLPWPQARELIARSAARAAGRGAVIAAGAGTDQLPPGPHALRDIVAAYEEQLELVQSAGAGVILMASRALAAAARSGQDYLDVYLHLLRQADRPVILHWLGTAFDPALAGYWGSDRFEASADLVLQLAERADGPAGATGHSDALLGAFAAVTAPAAAALHALDAGDLAGYDAAIGPTVA